MCLCTHIFFIYPVSLGFYSRWFYLALGIKKTLFVYAWNIHLYIKITSLMHISCLQFGPYNLFVCFSFETSMFHLSYCIIRKLECKISEILSKIKNKLIAKLENPKWKIVIWMVAMEASVKIWCETLIQHSLTLLFYVLQI